MGDIRLEGGGNILEGRVEIFTEDSLWATVCDDGWGEEDATVVCRQLGFPTEGRAGQREHFICAWPEN